MQLLTGYQQLANILESLGDGDLTVAEAHEQLTSLADLANEHIAGLNLVVPSVVELQERYKQTDIFTSSEEVYQESYQSSTC